MLTEGADPTAYLERLTAANPDDTKRDQFERVWVEMFRRSAILTTERATAAGFCSTAQDMGK